MITQSINPISIRVYPHKRGWSNFNMTPKSPFRGVVIMKLLLLLPHSNSNLSNSHSPSRSMAFSFSKPTLLLSFSTCVFHVFGHPRFLLPVVSNSSTFLITCPSSLQQMPVPSHSICFCYLNHCFLQCQHLHYYNGLLFGAWLHVIMCLVFLLLRSTSGEHNHNLEQAEKISILWLIQINAILDFFERVWVRV